MPGGEKGKICFLLEARDDLTGYVEAAVLLRKTATVVEGFIRREIFLRWGYLMEVVVDGGSEFKGEAQEILRKLSVNRVVISPYNSRANGVNEQGHFPIVASLTKALKGTGKNWKALLLYVLFADRTTVRENYG